MPLYAFIIITVSFVQNRQEQVSHEQRSSRPSVLTSGQYIATENQLPTHILQTSNWGWAQYARRDLVYYQADAVKTDDAFLIICTISSSPSPGTPISIPNGSQGSATAEAVDKGDEVP